MAYLGSWKIDDVLYFYANTTRFDTGVATDADSDAGYRVYENETGTPLLTGAMSLLDSANTAGFYSEAITLSAANGFEKGKQYSIYKFATVNGVAGASHDTFQMEAEVDANVVSDKTGYALSTAGVQAIWDALTSALTTVGSIGKLLVDRIDAAITSRLASGSYTAPDNASITAILADTNELQTDWTDGGRLDLILDARSSQTSVDDLPTNSELATALGTADDAVLAQVALVKTETDKIASIKTKTDSLTFTKTGEVDANVQSLNDTTLNGDGSGTPWGP